MHVINDERPRYLLTIKSIAVVLLFVIFRRMFKIYEFFLHDFIGFLTSINYMDKWVTPLGRVFKIYDIFLHEFIGFECQ